MLDDDTRIVKLSILLNTALRMKSITAAGRKAAYSKAIEVLEKSMPQPLIRSSNDSKIDKSIEKSDSIPSFETKTIKNDEYYKTYDQADIKENKNISTKKSEKIKKKMKWKDYLEAQVEKQKKINEQLGIYIKKQIKDLSLQKKSKKIVPAENKIDMEVFKKDFEKIKPSKLKPEFKKLDEQECFVEDSNEKKSDSDSFEDLKANANDQEDPDSGLQNIELENKNEEDYIDSRIKEIIQRYEKTIGKIKYSAKKEDSSRTKKISEKNPMIEERCKSSHSHYSADSQKDAYFQLKKLKAEEEKIKKKKEELIKFLESRSLAKGSSRPTTVASLYSKKETDKNHPQSSPLKLSANYPALPILPELPSSLKRPIQTSYSRNMSAADHTRRKSNTEVKDLINNLF
jgi:hypothetical protein